MGGGTQRTLDLQASLEPLVRHEGTWIAVREDLDLGPPHGSAKAILEADRVRVLARTVAVVARRERVAEAEDV